MKSTGDTSHPSTPSKSRRHSINNPHDNLEAFDRITKSPVNRLLRGQNINPRFNPTALGVPGPGEQQASILSSQVTTISSNSSHSPQHKPLELTPSRMTPARNPCCETAESEMCDETVDMLMRTGGRRHSLPSIFRPRSPRRSSDDDANHESDMGVGRGAPLPVQIDPEVPIQLAQVSMSDDDLCADEEAEEVEECAFTTTPVSENGSEARRTISGLRNGGPPNSLHPEKSARQTRSSRNKTTRAAAAETGSKSKRVKR